MPPRLFRHGELPLVLLAILQRQPCHGYQLLAELTRIFGRRYSASPGSVYPALVSLEKQGLVTATEIAGRRVYDISVAGGAALARCRPELVALEGRVGVRLLGGDVVDAALDRLTDAVAASRGHADPQLVARVLHDASDQLALAPHTLTRQGERR